MEHDGIKQLQDAVVSLESLGTTLSLKEIIERKAAIVERLYFDFSKHYDAYMLKSDRELFSQRLKSLDKVDEKLHSLRNDPEKFEVEEVEIDKALAKFRFKPELFQPFFNPDYEPPKKLLLIREQLLYLTVYYDGLKLGLSQDLMFPLETLLHMETVSTLLQRKVEVIIYEAGLLGRVDDGEIERKDKKTEGDTEKEKAKLRMFRLLAKDMKKKKPNPMADVISPKCKMLNRPLEDISDEELKTIKKIMIKEKIKKLPVSPNAIAKYLRLGDLCL